MTSSQLVIALGVAAIGVAAYGGVVHFFRSTRDMRNKRKQIQSRIDRDNEIRSLAVGELDLRLKNKLSELKPPSEGHEAMVEAQKALESVFYEWLSVYWYLFNLCDGSNIYISGIKNGEFVYDLPDNIARFLKRKQK